MSRSALPRLLFNFLRWLMYLWVRSETINLPAFQNSFASDKPVLYVLQRPSISDLAVMDQECIRNRLPRPMEPLKLAAHEELPAYFYLTQDADWHSIKDQRGGLPTLQRLLDAHEKGRLEAVQLVPVSVFWGQAPDRETSVWKLLFADKWAVTSGLRKFFNILLFGRMTRVQFSAPIQLLEHLSKNKNPQFTPRMIQRVLRVHFRNLKTAVIGPDLSHRRTLVENIVDEQPVRQAIADQALEEGLPIEKIRERALKYANEIASDYRYSMMLFFETILAWLWNSLYDGIQVKNMARIQEIVHGHELVYVPCHRSHIDYLLVSYLLFRNGLTPPHVAAGINLNMPVIGPFLRRCGAFYMRRTFKGNPLYTAVFTEYMHTLFTRGFSVEYFVEGGRSRTGRMLKPKTGMLVMTLKSYARDARLPIVFVPIYIGYERILEGSSYLGELRGAAKKKESIFDIFKIFSALKLRFGSVAVNFGEPIRLTEFLDQQQPDWRTLPLDAHSTPEWIKQASTQLSTRIACHLNDAAAINPVNLVALALLSTNKLALDRQDLAYLLDIYLDLLRQAPYSADVSLPEGNGETLIDHVLEMGMIKEQSDALGKILYMEERSAILLTYNRNNILHVTALPSLLACFFQHSEQIERREIHRLASFVYPHLQAELFIRWPANKLEGVIDQLLDALVDQGLLRRENHLFIRPPAISRQFVILNLLSKAILQSLQRFYITMSLLLHRPPHHLSPEELENLCTMMAQRLSILHGLNAPEFFDKSLFRQYIQILLSEGILSINQAGLLGYTEQVRVGAEASAERLIPAEIRLSIRQVTTVTKADS